MDKPKEAENKTPTVIKPHIPAVIELKQKKVRKSAEPSDNSRYMQKNLEVFNLPEINLFNRDEVLARLNEYFNIAREYDSKPTVVGLAMALGLSRQSLYEIKTGKIRNPQHRYNKIPEDVVQVIRKAYDYLEMLWEDYMQNGKINPVSGIFLGKNNYGYKDKQETVITPNYQKPEYDAESIRERYLPSKEVDGESRVIDSDK